MGHDSRTAAGTRVLQPSSALDTATKARVDLIEQSTRPGGDGFPTPPASIGSPSGRRVHRPAKPIPAGTTKER